MSRSFKKHAVIKSKNKLEQKRSNKAMRKKSNDIEYGNPAKKGYSLNGTSYKKGSESYSVIDYVVRLKNDQELKNCEEYMKDKLNHPNELKTKMSRYKRNYIGK